MRVPAVVWSLGSDLNVIATQSPRLMAVARRVLETAALVLTPSRALADRARMIAPGARRIEPFYRGIDLGLFDRLANRTTLRHQLGLPEKAEILACVGRLSPEKGTVEVLEAFGRLASRRSRLYLVLAGENLMGARLETLIEQTGSPERVVWLGAVSPDQVAAVLGAADMLLFASHAEGLPNVPLEAMATGTAVVSTTVGGVPEVLTDGENALLVPVGDAPAIAAATERLLVDEALRRRLSEAGRVTVREGFDARQTSAAFLQMLREVVPGR
jgi:glycosyltransferase involved in cell wall biosynthesis